MFIEKIKYLREYNNLKQIEIAKILKITQANYSRWENGIETIRLNKLNDLCNYYNVSMDYIIGKTNNKHSNKIIKLNKIIIGKRLKETRIKNNDTQQNLAKFLNTTQSTISAYESGKTLILTLFAIEICNKYNISLDWLCGK